MDPGGVPVMLGLSTFEFPDDQITASTNSDFAKCARLLQIILYGGWCPSTDSPDEYFEVKLGDERCVTGVSIQGRDPCTKDWQQTRDLLQLALGGVADKVPTQEKVLKRPPVRLVHAMCVALKNERDCFQDGWQIPGALLNYPDLDRDQKVQFFEE